MITAVIFDMDGVIIDSEPLYLQIERELFNELGLELTPEEHAKFVGRSDLWGTVKQTYGLNIDIDEIHKIEQKRYMKALSTSLINGPIEGVAEVIDKLHDDNITLALASSSPMDNINFVLNKFGLSRYFSHRVSGADLGTSKPHPEIFLKASGVTGSAPEYCLVVEDSTNGVRAAKAANMKCIGFRNPNSGGQDLSAADWVINSFDEFDLDKFDR